MIHEITEEMRTYLAGQSCPFPIVDGPGADITSLGPCYITVERDESGETFGPARGARPMNNPKHLLTRKIAVLITLRIQRTAPGALDFEHHRFCDHAVDLVSAAAYYVAALRKNEVSFQSGRYVVPPDQIKTEATSGAVYELRLTVDRAVFQQEYDKRGAPGATADITTITEIGPQPLALGALYTELGQMLTTESGSILTLEA